MVNMVLSLRDRLIYNIKDNVMKLRQVQKTKLESILDDIEEKLKEMQPIVTGKLNTILTIHYFI